MAQATAIRLTGDDLRIEDVWAAAVGTASAELSDEARAKMRAARELVERAAHGAREHTYGVNTGFGRFVSRSIPEELTGELQLRLLRSHACGVGEPYPPEIVRAAMLLRANSLAASCRTFPRAVPSARAAISLPSRISRSRSWARAKRGTTGSE